MVCNKDCDKARLMHAPQASYDPVFFKALFAVEDRHFWFRARNRVLAAVIQQLVTELPPGFRALEVGCGTGNTLRILEQECQSAMVVGIDLFSEGLSFARQRVNCPLVQGDVQQPPFQTPFEIIGLFDVLEHLPEDRQVLQSLHTMLAPRGKLIVTVPAHPSLWSYFDEASCHYRRYTFSELANKLTESGYKLTYITQYMASIFPLVWVGRRLAELAKSLQLTSEHSSSARAREELRIRPVVNEVLAWLLSQEVHCIIRRCKLPIGTSLLAVAEKR